MAVVVAVGPGRTVGQLTDGDADQSKDYEEASLQWLGCGWNGGVQVRGDTCNGQNWGQWGDGGAQVQENSHQENVQGEAGNT